jgi:homoserine kinase type II
MAEYTRISEGALRDLLSRYTLGKLESYQSLAGGYSNSSFKITTDVGEYVLAVCDNKSLRQIENLTALLVQLEQQQYPSPRLMLTSEGQRLSKHWGHPVYIKELIHGDVTQSLSENMLAQVGEQLARLHAVEPHHGLPTDHPYGIECFDDVLKGPVQHPFLNWLSAKRDFLQENTSPDLPKGFIHGDLFYDNLLFSKENLVAVLDLEEACHFTLAFDLGMSIVGCCVSDHLISKRRAKALIAGYQKERVLEAAERESLPVYIQYAATATAFWRFRQYHIRHPDPERAEAYLEMQALADHVLDLSQDDFQVA